MNFLISGFEPTVWIFMLFITLCILGGSILAILFTPILFFWDEYRRNNIKSTGVFILICLGGLFAYFYTPSNLFPVLGGSYIALLVGAIILI